MNHVYIVHEQFHGVVAVFRNASDAIREVNHIAEKDYGLNPKTDPLDATGTFAYGWWDNVWWSMEIVR